jgi:hypothetical protein
LAEDRFIIGGCDYCHDELLGCKEQWGIDHFILRMVYTEAAHEIISDSIELFGNEVIKRF